MGKGKNSGVSSSKKMTEVDEDQVLEVIENKKFLAMRATASSWPIPSTMEEQLEELADEGLIQD
jgi:ATP phosphoribosyltransferase regulatory subunit HisZ